jgi:hypothetical protein
MKINIKTHTHTHARTRARAMMIFRTFEYHCFRFIYSTMIITFLSVLVSLRYSYVYTVSLIRFLCLTLLFILSSNTVCYYDEYYKYI